VIVHEVLGHGCTALLCGGEFQRFVIHFDAMGMAWTNAPDHRVALLAGGIAVEVAIGLLLLPVFLRGRLQPLLRLALLVLAFCMLHDGLPYGFWDAWFEGTTGDVGEILQIHPAPALRVVLLVALGGLYVAAMFASTRWFFHCLEDGLGLLSRSKAIAIAATIVVFVAAAYLAFDWNQLIPGAGRVPSYAAIVLQIAAGAAAVRSRRSNVEPVAISRSAWTRAIAIAWLLGITTAATVGLWMQHGVQLSSA
jgi:hypothetical protein